MPVLDVDPGEGLAQLDHHARHPAIAHDEIGPQPERHQRQAPVQPLEEQLEIRAIGRLEQPVGRAAGLEPHQLGQRRIGVSLPRRPCVSIGAAMPALMPNWPWQSRWRAPPPNR